MRATEPQLEQADAQTKAPAPQQQPPHEAPAGGPISTTEEHREGGDGWFAKFVASSKQKLKKAQSKVSHKFIRKKDANEHVWEDWQEDEGAGRLMHSGYAAEPAGEVDTTEHQPPAHTVRNRFISAPNTQAGSDKDSTILQQDKATPGHRDTALEKAADDAGKAVGSLDTHGMRDVDTQKQDTRSKDARRQDTQDTAAAAKGSVLETAAYRVGQAAGALVSLPKKAAEKAGRAIRSLGKQGTTDQDTRAARDTHVPQDKPDTDTASKGSVLEQAAYTTGAAIGSLGSRSTSDQDAQGADASPTDDSVLEKAAYRAGQAVGTVVSLPEKAAFAAGVVAGRVERALKGEGGDLKAQPDDHAAIENDIPAVPYISTQEVLEQRIRREARTRLEARATLGK